MFDLTKQILLEVALKKSEISLSLQNIQVSGGFLMNYNPEDCECLVLDFVVKSRIHSMKSGILKIQ